MEHQNLWAPWRMEYIKQLDPNAGGGGACFLCEAARQTPGTAEACQRLVLLRDPRGVVLLNRYPYTSGHLLVAIDQHLGELSDLTPAQRGDLMELTALAERLVRLACHPQGVNIGINLGRCAGAGLPGHLHVHIVPRWNGDTNYMQTVGQVRVIPEALEETWSVLHAMLAKMK